MDITIPKSLEALVRRKVDEGHYTISYPWRRQYSSQAGSCIGRLRFSVCSFVLTRT